MLEYTDIKTRVSMDLAKAKRPVVSKTMVSLLICSVAVFALVIFPGELKFFVAIILFMLGGGIYLILQDSKDEIKRYRLMSELHKIMSPVPSGVIQHILSAYASARLSLIRHDEKNFSPTALRNMLAYYEKFSSYPIAELERLRRTVGLDNAANPWWMCGRTLEEAMLEAAYRAKMNIPYQQTFMMPDSELYNTRLEL